MENQTHIIQKVRLELSVPDQTSAWDIQQRISEFCHTRLGRIMDSVIRDLAPRESHLRIDRMELDLQDLSIHNMEEGLQEKLKEAFSQHLHQHLSGARITPHWKGKIHPKREKGLSSNNDSGPFPTAPCSLSRDGHWMEVLKFYLETGTTPWFVPSLQPGTLEEAITRLVEMQPEQARSFFQKQLKKPTPRRRLALQFPWPLIKQIVALLVTKKNTLSKEIDSCLEAANRAVSQPSAKETLREAALEASLEATGQTSFFTRFFLTIIHGLSPDQLPLKPDILNAIEQEIPKESSGESALRNQLLSAVSSIKKNIKANKTGAVSPQSPAPSPPDPEKLIRPPEPERANDPAPPPTDTIGYAAVFSGEAPFPSHMVSQQPPQADAPAGHLPDPGHPAQVMEKNQVGEAFEKKSNDAEIKALDAIYVENAGLVLLWPYLGRLFDAVGLTEKNRFVTEDARATAVALLQFMACGEEEPPEFRLPLNKLLCGWDPGTPIRRKTTFPKLAREESQKLIEAVITHWAALKNTSPQAFQTSFLQRNGVLEKKEKCWRLRVERKPYDLLLERLPWSVSMIRLSWMRALLQVEWQP